MFCVGEVLIESRHDNNARTRNHAWINIFFDDDDILVLSLLFIFTECTLHINI